MEEWAFSKHNVNFLLRPGLAAGAQSAAGFCVHCFNPLMEQLLEQLRAEATVQRRRDRHAVGIKLGRAAWGWCIWRRGFRTGHWWR